MSYKNFLHILNYDEEKDNFSKEEQQKIEADLREKTKKSLQKIGNKFIDFIDSVNDR